MTASWPLKAEISSGRVYASEMVIVGMPGGKVAREEVRVRMVVFRWGVERSAVRMGAPTEPVAPMRRMLVRGGDILGGRGGLVWGGSLAGVYVGEGWVELLVEVVDARW